VCSFYTIVGNVWQKRACRLLVNDETFGSFQIRLDCLVNHVHLEILTYVEKLDVDVLQGFVVGLQGSKKVRFSIHEFLGYESIANSLQDMTPFGSIGASMRSSKEDDAIRRDEDGAFFIVICEARGKIKCLKFVSSKFCLMKNGWEAVPS